MKSYLVLRFKIKDYAQFKRAFDAKHEELHRQFDLHDTWVNRNIDDSSELIIVSRCGDVNRAREFVKSSALAEAMKEAGVAGTASFSFLEELVEVRETVGVGSSLEGDYWEGGD
jgi:hypothetical protein